MGYKVIKVKSLEKDLMLYYSSRIKSLGLSFDFTSSPPR